jgi:hypothetical protein
MKKFLTILILFFAIGARATNYTYPTANNNISITNSTFGATLNLGDTVWIPVTQLWRTFSIGNIGPINSPSGLYITILPVGWPLTTFSIIPHTSPIFGNTMDSCNWVHVLGWTMNDDIDVAFYTYASSGHSHHMWFDHCTFQGMNGFFNSSNPSFSLQNWGGPNDSVNCFFKWRWSNCVFDSIVGANSGQTAVWMGSIAQNQFWFDVDIDSCHFGDYSSSSDPAGYVHAQYIMGLYMYNDSTWNLADGVANPVGHAAQIYIQECYFEIWNCHFGPHNFGDEVRNIGACNIPGMTSTFSAWTTAYNGTTYDGRSKIFNNIVEHKRKYPCFETRTDPGDTTSYIKMRASPYVDNITAYSMAIGVGNEDYYATIVDFYGSSTDSLFLHNSTWSVLGDTVAATFPFYNGTYGIALVSEPNGAPAYTDTANNFGPVQYFNQSALADTVQYNPILGGAWSSGVAAHPFPSFDIYQRARNTSGSVYKGAVTGVSSGPQTGFYFDAISGSDANACTLAAPCQTKTAFNALSLVAGDTVYFKRGQTFPGGFFVTASGTSGSHIVIKPYGTGSQPNPGGVTPLTLTHTSGNLYQQTGYTGVPPNFLVQNGTIMPWANSGLMTYIPSGSTTTVLDVGSNASLAPAGTILAVMSSSYTWDVVTVTVQGSTTLTVSPALTFMNPAGDVASAWMIMNGTPTVTGQWNYVSGTITVNSLTTPTGWGAPTYDTVFYVSGQYIDFDSLTISGGNNALVYASFQTAGGPTLNNDSLIDGYDLLFSRGSSHWTVTNCVMEQATDNGFFREDPTYFQAFTNDIIKYIGMNPGMGRSGNAATYSGINYANGDSANTLTGLTIDSVGYLGIGFSGSSSVVNRNVVGHCMQIKGDGAAIYTWIPSGTTYHVPDSICYNYAYKIGGSVALSGSTSSSVLMDGIYLDAYSNNILVSHNTVDSAVGAAIFVKGINHTVTYNTTHNSGYAEFWAFEQSGGATITGLSVNNNQFGAISSSDADIRLQTVNNDLSTFGTINNNYYAHALLTAPFWMQNSSGNSYLTLAGWTSALGYDVNSTFLLRTMSFYGNPTQSTGSANIPVISSDLLGNRYQNTVTLQPRTGLLLYPIGSFIGPIPRGVRIIISN